MPANLVAATGVATGPTLAVGRIAEDLISDVRFTAGAGRLGLGVTHPVRGATATIHIHAAIDAGTVGRIRNVEDAQRKIACFFMNIGRTGRVDHVAATTVLAAIRVGTNRARSRIVPSQGFAIEPGRDFTIPGSVAARAECAEIDRT